MVSVFSFLTTHPNRSQPIIRCSFHHGRPIDPRAAVVELQPLVLRRALGGAEGPEQSRELRGAGLPNRSEGGTGEVPGCRTHHIMHSLDGRKQNHSM